MKDNFIECECGHSVPEEFAYQGDAENQGYTCAKCVISYIGEELKQAKELMEKTYYLAHRKHEWATACLYLRDAYPPFLTNP